MGLIDKFLRKCAQLNAEKEREKHKQEGIKKRVATRKAKAASREQR